MQCVHIAYEPVSANIVKAYLESHGVEAQVRDERTFSLQGEVPVVYPSVWVSDEDAIQARQLVDKFERERKAAEPAKAVWICPRCGETHAATYTECWRCAGETAPSRQEDGPGTGSHDERAPSPFRIPRLALAAVVVLLLASAYCVNRSARRDAALGHVDTAVQLADAGQWDASLAELDQALRLDGNCWEAQCRRGWVLLDLKRTEEALAAFEEAVRMEPNADTFYSRGYAHLELCHWHDAERDCSASIEAIPETLDVYLVRGTARDSLGDLEGARRDYRHVVKSDATKVDAFTALLYLSDLQLSRGHAREAMAMLDEAIALLPATPSLLVRRAHLHWMAGRDRDAFSDLDEALRTSPDRSNVLVLRSSYLLDSGRAEEALSVLERLPKRAMKDLLAQFTKGLVLSRLERAAEAREVFSLIALSDARDSHEYAYRGYARAMLGDFEEALADARRAREARPWSSRSEYWSACIYAARAASHPDDDDGRAQRQEDMERGLEHLQNALDKGGQHDAHFFEYGELSSFREDPRFQALKAHRSESAR